MENNNRNKNNIDLSEINFLTNTPKSYDDYNDYAIILSKMIEDKSVKNIGIVAPYGAGKSSLIKKYIENTNKSKKIITISLANYNSILKNKFVTKKRDDEHDLREHLDVTITNFENQNNRNNEYKQTENEIEKSILQQLLYKNSNKKTPYSRFSMLKNKNWFNCFISLVTVIFLLLSTVLILSFSNIRISFLKYIKHNFMIVSILVLVICICLFILVFNFIKSRQIKNIQLGNIGFEKNNENEISVFNQYLDEIIYFFQNNKYSIILIEDLDRFENLEIFSKLKELNTLLNNNDMIRTRHKKITFIYAVKDSMFKDEEERSKFFEFILPVIPSITRDNVRDELVNNLDDMLHINPLNDDLIVDICDYITSRRVLNNIINDFIIHLKLLEIDISDKNKCSKLFSLMALKNINPIEYEQLQAQTDLSEIYTILKNKKNSFQNDIIVNIDKKINELEKEIDLARQENVRSFSDLILLLMGTIVNDGHAITNIITDLKTFKDVTYIEYNYYNSGYGTYSTKKKLEDLEIKYFNEKGYFYRSEINILNKSNERQKELFDSLQAIKKEKNTILNMNFSELYELAIEFNLKIDFKNDLVKLLLVNGYVDETHMDYLSTHDYSFISENDKSIIRQINLKNSIGFLTKIDNPDRVIMSLYINRFKFNNIINFDIINTLFKIESREKIKKDSLIECLKNNKVEFKKFLAEILSSEVNYFECLLNLLKEIDYVWKLIEEIPTINDDAKSKLLIKILNNSNVNIKFISKINVGNCVEERINKINTFGNDLSSTTYSIMDLNAIIDIKIKQLENFVVNDNNNFLLINELFEFNYNNICEILQNYFKFNIEDIRNKNYELVCSIGDCEFYQNVHSNIENYCSEIYNNIEEGNISSEYLLNLLTNDAVSSDTKELIALKETSLIEYNEETQLDLSILNILIRKNQIYISIDDLIKIYNDIAEEDLIAYINNNIQKLGFNSNILRKDKDFANFVFEKIDIAGFVEKLEKGEYENLEINNEKNIRLLIKHGCMKYNWSDFLSFISVDNVILEYCLKFENNISNDIVLNQFDLDAKDRAKIYKLSKHSFDNMFNKLMQILDAEDLKEILTFETIEDFVENIQNYSILREECKCELLKQNINKNIKEKILCTFTQMSEEALKTLIIDSLDVNNYKYDFCNYEFYKFVYSKKIVLRKIGNTLYLKKN